MAMHDYESDVCSIARSAALFGDRWSLLIIRDILNGVCRFDELTSHLGVSREVLNRRLGVLVDGGLLDRVPYKDPGDRARHEYRLTRSGLELVPVLLAFMAWGDRHLAGPDGPPVRPYHRDCGAGIEMHLTCADGHEVDPAREIRLEPGPGARLATRRSSGRLG